MCHEEHVRVFKKVFDTYEDQQHLEHYSSAFRKHCCDHINGEKYLLEAHFGFCSLPFVLINVTSGSFWR